ncbi:ABC transporter permease subunit [Saccharopolyspora spinosa]|uniref:ABC transporter permease subunit n=1 Tax=Saccharopolyspora spinosa TaxID=60894 RepID=UPI002351DC31|nr:ABC transporter permease subunit [Saccharopolyspora spinosa]
MVLPAFVLGSGLAAVLMRQLRSSMLDALCSDYVVLGLRADRARQGRRGVGVVAIHGLRNSLITVMTTLSLRLGTLISGTVVTEQILMLPGFGKLMVEVGGVTKPVPRVEDLAVSYPGQRAPSTGCRRTSTAAKPSRW